MTTARTTCHKHRFPDEYTAGKMLKRAQERAERNGYKGPVRYYEHLGPSGCGGFHLTSRAEREEIAA